MKTKIFLFAIAFVLNLVSTLSFAQKVDIKGVTSIEVNIACQLVLVQGSSPNMEIIGDKQAVADVETKFKNGKLILRSDRKSWEKDDIVVKIEVEDLKYLGIGGAVDLKTAKKIKLDEFELNVSGVGNIEMQLETNRFQLSCTGVGNIELTGNTEELNIKVSGVGNVKAIDFVAKNAQVTNSGVGRVNVNVTEKLDAKVTGIGSISYEGKPLLNANVTGLGRISRY